MALLDDVFNQLHGQPSLSADDTLQVRRGLYGGADQTVAPADADLIAQLNRSASDASPEWQALYAEVMVDYLINQATPRGYVEPAKATWLTSAVSTPPKADEMELLIEIMERAETTPPELSAFVLDAIKQAILERAGKPAVTGVDIAELRRVLFAAAGPENIGVSRAEAETMFDINDAVSGGDNDAAWAGFFAGAVANAVLYEATYHAPDAATVLKREAWLADNAIHPRQMLDNLLHMRGLEAPSIEEAWEMGVARDGAIERAASAVNADEAHWLIARLGQKPGLDEAEQALVAFLRANASAIEPALQAFVNTLADPQAKTAAA